MARKTTSRRRNQSADPLDAIIDGYLALLAERRYGEITLRDIAAAANLSLAELRGLVGGRGDILAAFVARIDRQVLDGSGVEGETARDRLFDVIMQRLDALEPHKAALRSLARAARYHPDLAAAVARIGCSSTRWMLAAADIRDGGARGAIVRAGSGLIYAEAFRTWLDDDDPGLGRTMAALDQGLRRGDSAMRAMGRVRRRLCQLAEAGRQPRQAD